MAEIHTKESGILLFNEEDYRISVAHEIKLNMPNLTDGERAAALAILEAGAGSMNMSLSEYVAQTFPNGIFGNLNILKSQQQKGEKINGAVDIRGFGENVRALIYAGESADFSTFVHELAHVWQAQLTGQLKSDAEKAFKVENGDWLNSIYTFSNGTNDTCGEAFAYGFEDFLKHKAGEMATEDKKKIFEIFADYMSRTYNGMEENIEISPEIAEVYNAFVSLDDNVLSQAEKAVQEEKKRTFENNSDLDNNMDSNNLQYQIVSESSIRKMAASMEKNRILQNLKAAVLLDEDKKLENLTPESKAARIRMETGWEKGVDGTWKYETDDSISFIKNGSGIQKLLDQDAGSLTKLSDGIPLKNLLEAPELFDIFPFMQDVKVRFYDEVDTYRGSLSSDGIMINTHYLKDVNGEKGFKGILAYEIQHIIQAVEYTGKTQLENEDIEMLYMETMKAMKENGTKYYDYDVNSVNAGISDYIISIGEIEARNVARRIAYSATERRHKTLQSTEDVSRNLQYQIQKKIYEKSDNLQYQKRKAKTQEKNMDNITADKLSENEKNILKLNLIGSSFARHTDLERFGSPTEIGKGKDMLINFTTCDGKHMEFKTKDDVTSYVIEMQSKINSMKNYISKDELKDIKDDLKKINTHLKQFPNNEEASHKLSSRLSSLENKTRFYQENHRGADGIFDANIINYPDGYEKTIEVFNTAIEHRSEIILDADLSEAIKKALGISNEHDISLFDATFGKERLRQREYNEDISVDKIVEAFYAAKLGIPTRYEISKMGIPDDKYNNIYSRINSIAHLKVLNPGDLDFNKSDSIYRFKDYKTVISKQVTDSSIHNIEINSFSEGLDFVSEILTDDIKKDMWKDAGIEPNLIENEINISLPHSSWSENLKQVITNSSYQAMLDNRDLQIAGKAGDEEAAKKLVSKISDINIIKKLATDFPNATVVPIPSMETADKKPNAIPLAYAEQFEQFGLNVADDIIEIDSIHHTGKKAFKRVVNRPHFDGNIQAGKEYIIVDDVYAMGGTVNSMRSFIENKGGKVVAVSTLTPSVENSKILAITEEHLDQLKEIDKNGELKNAIRNLDIAENFESLTDPIGQYIFNNREKIINEDRTRRAKNDSKEHVKENSRNFNRKIDNTSNNIEKVLKEDESYHIKYFNNIPVQQLSGNNLSEHLVKTLSETARLDNEEFIDFFKRATSNYTIAQKKELNSIIPSLVKSEPEETPEQVLSRLESFIKNPEMSVSNEEPSVSNPSQASSVEPVQEEKDSQGISDELRYTYTPELEKENFEPVSHETPDHIVSEQELEKGPEKTNEKASGYSYKEFLVMASELKTPEEYEKFFQENFNFKEAAIKQIPPIADKKAQLFVDNKPSKLVIDYNQQEVSHLANWCLTNNMALFVPHPEDVKKQGIGLIAESLDKLNKLLGTDIKKEISGQQQGTELNSAEQKNQAQAVSGLPLLYEGSEWSEEELKLIKHVEMDKIPEFIADPYKADVAVPRFGMCLPDPETGEYKMQEQVGWHFAQKEIQNGCVSAIILTKINESGIRDFIKIDPTTYEAAINRNKELMEEWGKPRFKETHIKALYDYENALGVSKTETRSNTCAEYFHNFEAACRGAEGFDIAHNETEAMENAKQVYLKMSPHEKMRMHQMEKDWETVHGTSFHDELLRRFYEVRKDMEISQEQMRYAGHNFEDGIVSKQSLEDGKVLGELDNVSHKKIGDTIKISLKSKDYNGRVLDMPVTEMKIAGANKATNTVLLVDPEKNTSYQIPFDKFVGFCQKQELKHSKEQQKVEKVENKMQKAKQKKDIEDYGFDR